MDCVPSQAVRLCPQPFLELHPRTTSISNLKRLGWDGNRGRVLPSKCWAMTRNSVPISINANQAWISNRESPLTAMPVLAEWFGEPRQSFCKFIAVRPVIVDGDVAMC